MKNKFVNQTGSLYYENNIWETFYSPVQVWNELIFIMTHTRPEVSDSNISLLGPSRNEHDKTQIEIVSTNFRFFIAKYYNQM